MSDAPTRPARPIRLVRRIPRAWFIPVAVTAGLRIILEFALLNSYQLVAVALGIPAIVFLARRPALAIRLLVIVLPFQLVITSLLYELGVAGTLVRMAGLWKELAALSVIVAAWGAATRSRHRLDALDRVALAYVLLGTAYLVVPELLLGDSLGTSLSVDVRFIGWRTMVLPVVLFIAARHVRLAPHDLERLIRVAVGVGIALGAIALFEFVASDSWNTLMVDTLGVNRFRVEVLEVNPASFRFQFDDVRIYGEVAGREFVRVGGPMASYLQLSFALLVAGGLLFERVIRGVRSFSATVGIILVGTGLLFTQTRSSIVGGVLLAVAVLRPGAGRSETTRVRYTLLAAAAFALVLPLVFSSGLSDRFTSGDSASDDNHDASFDHAYEVARSHPMGTGLSTGAGAGAANVPEAITAENHFLDVALQLGWLGVALYVAFLALLIRTLHRTSVTARDPTVQTGLLGTRNSVIALLVPCWYLHALLALEVSWVLFALAGAALGSAAWEDTAAYAGKPDQRAVRR